MATYKIEFAESKTKDWVVADLEAGGALFKDVSINRVNKKGETFPNFDSIRTGGSIEGELWDNPSGKKYLFAPRTPKTASGGAYKSQQVKEAQDRKREDIERFQGSKEESIRLMSAQRDSVLIVTTLIGQGIPVEDIKEEIIKWRNWFLSADFEEHPPF